MADEETQNEPPAAEAPEEAAPEATSEQVEPEAAAEEAAAEEAAAGPEAAAEEPATEEAPAAAEEPERRKKRKRLPRPLRHKHSKPARTPAGKRKPITRTPKPESRPGRRQERRGVVVSDRGDKSIVVEVQLTRQHPKYKKVVRLSRKLHAHDEQNAAAIGDLVRIVETRPLSKTKRWRLAEIMERAK